MCTVTFFPLENQRYVLTSNRDEQPERDTLKPTSYTYKGVAITSPRDKVAGGTWIAYGENKRMLTLMNGGFENHIRKSEYRLSRGIVVLELLVAADLYSFLDSFNFEGIEPLTVVLFDLSAEPLLLLITWDEVKIHLDKLPLKPYIWSSSPLYTKAMKTLREEWLATFNRKVKVPTPQEICEFHQNAGIGDQHVDVIMNRGFIHTKSTTQIVMDKEGQKIKYFDQVTRETTEL